MGGGTLFDSFALFDFITAALRCKRLIKSILNKEHKSCRLILLFIYCLLPQLFSLLEVMLINQLPSCLLKHVAVCLFNQLLAHFLIKGDNVGSFPSMAGSHGRSLAGHRLSSTTALKFKIICNVCFCLATLSFLSAELKTKIQTYGFFCISTLLTPTQVKDRKMEAGGVLSLCWHGACFSGRRWIPAKLIILHHMMILRIILWREGMLECKGKVHTGWSMFLACSSAGLGPSPVPLWPQSFFCLLSAGILLTTNCNIKSFLCSLYSKASKDLVTALRSPLFLPLRYPALYLACDTSSAFNSYS